jgi:hypothetical protein
MFGYFIRQMPVTKFIRLSRVTEANACIDHGQVHLATIRDAAISIRRHLQ